ncbi:MAG: hypothetical protein MZV64_08095 [Ignavibacteriales bacterium]|nr:hypothetical protein [Ignavibacteriales bacterium]
MNPVLMIFIDGVGIGNKDYEFNPFFKYGFKIFDEIFKATPYKQNPYLEKNGMYVFPADAKLRC